MTALDTIEALHSRIRPCLQEVAASRMVAGKGRALRVFTSPFDAADVRDGAFLQSVMGDSVSYVTDVQGTLSPGRWLGDSFVICDASATMERASALAAGRGGGAPADHLGRFLVSLSYRVTDRGDVFVSPFCAYFMMFNMRIHGFDHRFDKDVADFPASHLSREVLLNYLLASYPFYEHTWHTVERPW